MGKSTNQARYGENPPAVPDVAKQDDGKYSLHIHIGWTFANDPKNWPCGQYTLKVAGQTVHDGRGNRFSNGQIIIDRALQNVTGSGKLIIKLTDGRTYRGEVVLGNLKPIQTREGLACRLTNLGFFAGDGKANNRLCWAIRAFKRVVMNNFIRNKVENENNDATPKFLGKVQSVYGGVRPYPGDDITKKVKLNTDAKQVPYCGMFGTRVYRRGDSDNSKVEHKSEPIAGDFTIYLRAFDPEEKDPKRRGPFSNRVNLPQPIRMAQFVLFELGYWLIAEEGSFIWERIDDTWTRNEYRPNGEFGQHTQWAVQGFQRYSKLAHAVRENVASKELRYLSRLLELADEPPEVSGDARYPVAAENDGVVNQATKKALQAWADEALRCPVVVFPSVENSTGGFYSDYKAKERQYELRQFDHYFQWRYVTPDESIWVKMLHGAYAVGEIISGGIGIAGGCALATGGSETGVLIPVGIIVAAHGSDTLASGINDLVGVFSQNRVGYGMAI
jgi:peptidoglycan hydrolase-like protein with peptidoglycan-binding domain